MAALYRAADACVSPYRAEGFNLPVLEAAASGLPVICTAGGATDDFVSDSFALKIRSELAPVRLEGDLTGQWLEPEVDHVASLMFDVIEPAAGRREAAVAGPTHAAFRYDWSRVTRLLGRCLIRRRAALELFGSWIARARHCRAEGERC